MNIKILTLVCLFYNNSNAFLINPRKEYRKLRLKYSFLIKKNETILDNYTKDRVLENMSMIVKDDLSNDVLYFIRFYHIVNYEQSSYFYIVFYELLSFMIRNDKKIYELHISIINIFIYILLKNIVINHYIHHTL
jgi:hypothetical protein